MLNFRLIGKPFPAESMEDAISVIKKRHFKGYNPSILVTEHPNIAYITIPIPGRQKLTYMIEKTRLLVK